jgi:hypothetical protein
MKGWVVSSSHLTMVHRTDACAKNRSLGKVVEVEFEQAEINPWTVMAYIPDDPFSVEGLDGGGRYRGLCGICWR